MEQTRVHAAASSCREWPTGRAWKQQRGAARRGVWGDGVWGGSVSSSRLEDAHHLVLAQTPDVALEAVRDYLAGEGKREERAEVARQKRYRNDIAAVTCMPVGVRSKHSVQHSVAAT